MGCDRLVKQAIKQSEVPDDDLIQVRYRKREPSATIHSTPDDLLALADFLVSHTEAKENVELSSELFLQRTANSTDVVEIPATLDAAVRSSDEIKQLSNQTLLAIHRNAIKRNDQDSAEPAIRAATILVDRFGTDRFGVLQGTSQAKEVLVKQVVMPTLEKMVFPNLVFDKNHLIPSGISDKSNQQSQLVVEFCALVSPVLQDQIAKLSYDDPDEHLKDLLAIQAMATKDASLSADSLRPKLDDVAKTLAILPDLDGLLLLNLADQLKQKGCGNIAYDLLKARSLQKQSTAESNTREKRQLLETAYQLVSDVARRLESEKDPSENAALMRYETLANAADLGVQLAFLVQEPQGKESLLLNSVKQIEQALSIYRAQWRGRTVMTLFEAIMTEGNAHEDLGHYVYRSKELASAEKANQHFEQCFASFRKALQDASLAMKATTYLGRALYRYSLAKEPRKASVLLEEADRVLGDSPTDLRTPSDTVRTEQMVKWCLWRLQVDAKLNNRKSGLRSAELAMDLISKNELPMDLATDAAYHSGIAYGNAKDWTQAVRCFSFHGNDGDINNIVFRAGALTDIAFRSDSPSKLLFQDVLRMFKHASELATQGQRVDGDGAYHSAKVAMRCTVELANERNSGLTNRSTTCERRELISGVTDFATLIKGQSPPEYADLGPLYVNCGKACDKGDHEDLLTSACDLAQQLNDSTDYSDFFQAANLRIVQLMVESGDQAMMANGLSLDQRNAQYTSERKQILSRMSKRILNSPSLNKHGALRDSANTMIKFLDEVP